MGRRMKNYGIQIPIQTIATTAATGAFCIISKSGTVQAAYFSGNDALAAHATNLLSFTIINMGQAGAGTTDLILATAANSTNSTGGAALAANTKRALTIHGTAANLAVTEGDRIKCIATASGTLANTVTFGNFLISIDANGQ